MDPHRLYEVLKRRIEEDGIYVPSARARIAPSDQGFEGWYSPDPWGNGSGPQIWVYTQDDKLAELFTLAHEYGHAQSDRDGYHSDRYREIRDEHGEWPGLSLAEKRMILEEEKGAWDLGRNALEEIAFSDWHAFEHHRTRKLRDYRTRLGMEE